MPRTPRRKHVFIALSLAAALPACAQRDAGTITKTQLQRTQHTPPSEHVSRKVIADPVSALDQRIFVVFQAKDKTYWFGSDGQGVYRVKDKAILHFTTEHGLKGNRVRSIQEDALGRIYVNSDGGVSRFDGRTFHAVPVANTDPSQGQWRLAPDDLWFTGWQDEGVVYRYDGKALHRLAFPKTEAGEAHIAKYPRSQFPAMTYSPYDTYTIFKDGKGNLWFGTSTLGACRYDGKSFAWISKDELEFNDAFGVRSVVEDKDGHFWFSKTLSRFAANLPDSSAHGNVALSYQKLPGIGNAKGDESPPSHFISAVNDKNGNLWLATLGLGVWRYDGANMTNYPVRVDNKGIWIFSIYKDRNDDLWLGTHEHGAYKFNGTKFEKFEF